MQNVLTKGLKLKKGYTHTHKHTFDYLRYHLDISAFKNVSVFSTLHIVPHNTSIPLSIQFCSKNFIYPRGAIPEAGIVKVKRTYKQDI